MSYKSVLKSNRTFLDPGNTTASTTLTAHYTYTTPASTTPIPVVSTSDFKQYGYLVINGVTFYYTGKTVDTFTGVTRISGSTSSFMSGAEVTQTYTVPNQIATEDTGLAGWYVDGAGNQASLRVSDTPVIQPGVIRYTSETGFQGCTSTEPITWVTFDATTGPQGETGIINGIVEFAYTTPTGYPTSNNAGIIAPGSLNTPVIDGSAEPIYIKPIVSGSTQINGIDIDTTRITDNSNSIVLNPVAQPYTWDLTPTVTTLRAPITGTIIKHYGQTEKYTVRDGAVITTGQAVRITTESSQLVIEPFTYSTPSDLDPYNYLASTPSIAFAGIALETVTGDGTLTANVCSGGIVPVKISSSVVPTDYGTKSATINRPGYACLLNTDGFSVCCTAINTDSGSKWFEIGSFMESGGVATNGGYVLVKINPRFGTS